MTEPLWSDERIESELEGRLFVGPFGATWIDATHSLKIMRKMRNEYEHRLKQAGEPIDKSVVEQLINLEKELQKYQTLYALEKMKVAVMKPVFDKYNRSG